MKVKEYEVPEELYYTKEHEWVKVISKDRVIVGITDYAVKMLKDIVYFSLPRINQEINFMDSLGTVESIKAVSEIYSPLTGKVIKVNERLLSEPELAYNSPYQEGWIVEMEPKRLDDELKLLLKSEDYAKLLQNL
ncbi:MAG: glycine cleavage system protein GcvH [Nitrososphaerales archaeon]